MLSVSGLNCQQSMLTCILYVLISYKKLDHIPSSWILNRVYGKRSSIYCVRWSSYFAFGASITKLRSNSLKDSASIVNHQQSHAVETNSINSRVWLEGIQTQSVLKASIIPKFRILQEHLQDIGQRWSRSSRSSKRIDHIGTSMRYVQTFRLYIAYKLYKI